MTESKTNYSSLSAEAKKVRKSQHWEKRLREMDGRNFPAELTSRLDKLIKAGNNKLELSKKIELLNVEREFLDLCPKTSCPNSSKFSKSVAAVIIGKQLDEIKEEKTELQTELQKALDEVNDTRDFTKFGSTLTKLGFSEAKIQECWQAANLKISFWQGFRHLYDCAMSLGQDEKEAICLIKTQMLQYSAEVADYLRTNGQAQSDMQFNAELVLTPELKKKQEGFVTKRTSCSSLTAGLLKACDIALNGERGDFSRIQLLTFSVGHHLCFMDVGAVLWFELGLPDTAIKTCWDQRLQIVNFQEHPEIRVELVSLNVPDCEVVFTADDSATLM